VLFVMISLWTMCCVVYQALKIKRGLETNLQNIFYFEATMLNLPLIKLGIRKREERRGSIAERYIILSHSLNPRLDPSF